MSRRTRRDAAPAAPTVAAAPGVWRGALLWTAIALAVRLLYFAQMKASPFAGHPLIDADTYDQWAQDIAHGAWIGREAFWQPPLYPYVLGILYKLAGHSYEIARFAQGLLSAASAGLIYAIGCRTSNRLAAACAAGVFALYGTAIVFDGLLLSVSLIVFLECAFVWLTLRALDAPAGGRWALAGLALGLSILARPEIGIAGAGVAAWLALRRGREWTTAVRTRALAALLGVAALCTATATLHNYIAERDLIAVSYNAGVNFYLGNNAHYDETVNARPYFEWRRLARLPAQHGITRASAQSAWFFRESLDWMTHHPLDAATLWLRKLGLSLRGREVMRNEDLYAARPYSWLLAVLLWMKGVAFPFGVIGPLAAIGLVVGRRRDGAVLWLTAAASLVTCAVFFVSARYRLPAIPVIALWAGEAVAWGWRRFRAGDSMVLARAGGAWIALIALCNAGQGPATTPAVAAETQLALATIATTDGAFDQALVHCRNARALKPEYPEADYAQANAFLSLNRPDSAAAYAVRAAQAAPDIEDTWQLLAAIEQRRERYPEAADAARRALAVDPALPGARSILAVCLAQVGDAAGAHAQADSTAALPDVPPPVTATIARVYFAVGDGARALATLDRALAAGAPPELAELREAMRAQLASPPALQR